MLVKIILSLQTSFLKIHLFWDFTQYRPAYIYRRNERAQCLRNVAKDWNLHHHCCENLKSRNNLLEKLSSLVACMLNNLA
jgi:hypothetical protein